MNDNELARIYFDHHAGETDRRSQLRLTALMHRAAEHDATCSTPQCPLTLRSFLHGDVVAHITVTEGLLARGILEDDDARHQAITGWDKFIVRVYFPKHGRAVTGVMKA